MQLRTHITDLCKKTHSKLPFLWQILQLLSIFSNTGVPFDTVPQVGSPWFTPIQYTAGFEPTTLGREPSALTTKPGFSPNKLF